MIINDFVVKVASRCNLNCSYCYMYNMGDTTYKNQPKLMSLDLVLSLAKKIKNHCHKNGSKSISIVFHGGEPLLAPKEFYINVVEIFQTELEKINVSYVIQTNGTLLDEEWCELFNKLNIRIGVSIDGPEAFQNQYRVYHNNKGSYSDVERGIKVRNRYSNGGLICVINIEIPPIELYQFFLNLNSTQVSFLLPDNHHDNLPHGKIGDFSFNDTKYGDWLIELYNIWARHESPSRPRIIFFETLIGIILGEERGDELVGKRKNGVITIETNGDIEIPDPLRICGNGFTRDNLNVLDNEISDIESNKIFQKYYNSHDELCKKCKSCPIEAVCGGGYLAHRFSKKNQFENPTIYCNDLIKLITHIQSDIINRLPPNIIKKLKIQSASYKDIFNIIHNN